MSLHVSHACDPLWVNVIGFQEPSLLSFSLLSHPHPHMAALPYSVITSHPRVSVHLRAPSEGGWEMAALRLKR